MGSKMDTPYSERTLEERIETNWKKTIGLMKRGEFSTVVIRAATTVELASNLLIKHEFENNRGLPTHFVENLMVWANGFMGKIDRLLIPIFRGTPNEQSLKEVKKRSKDINDERNNIVHRGQFKAKKTAQKVLEESAYIINELARLSGSQLTVDPVINDEEDDA
tara:strand:- start:931 stop:1422 length:492 start_codon:yes stop_codon:yes gene_type:complete